MNYDHLRSFGRGLTFMAISVVFLGGNDNASSFLSSSLTKMEYKFSRTQESAADGFALDLLNKAYGHVGGASDFFERLGKDRGALILFEYFSTHPVSSNRVEQIHEWTSEKRYIIKEKILLSEILKGKE